MQTWHFIVIGVLVLGIVAWEMFKGKRSKAQANSGVDKATLLRFVSEATDTPAAYTTVFAYWKDGTISGTASRIRISTVSTYYALAFGSEALYLIPLIVGETSLSRGEAIRLDADNLGLVNGKDGHHWLTLYDKDMAEIVNLFVDAENLKSDDYPVDIMQKEEQARYLAWIPTFMQRINTANGREATGKMGKASR